MFHLGAMCVSNLFLWESVFALMKKAEEALIGHIPVMRELQGEKLSLPSPSVEPDIYRHESSTMLGPSGAHRIIFRVGRDPWGQSSPTPCSWQECTKLSYWQNFSISRLPSTGLLRRGACFRQAPVEECDTENENPRMRSTGFRVLAFFEGSVDFKESPFSTP